MNSLSIVLMSCLSLASAQTLSSATTNNPTATDSIAPIETNGFNVNDMNTPDKQESWLKQNDRYIFIIFLAVLALAVLIWYIVKSIQNMRHRLASENQGQMIMTQETINTNGFHKLPHYSEQPNYLQQQQQPYEHRY